MYIRGMYVCVCVYIYILKESNMVLYLLLCEINLANQIQILDACTLRKSNFSLSPHLWVNSRVD